MAISRSEFERRYAGMVLDIHPSIMTTLLGDACGAGYTYLITETGAERFSQVELPLSGHQF